MFHRALVALLGVLLIANVGGSVSTVWPTATAAAARIHASPDSSGTFSSEIVCRPDCALAAFLVENDQIVASDKLELSGGEWTLTASTPFTRTLVPIAEFEYDEWHLIIEFSLARDSETDMLIAVMATRPVSLTFEGEGVNLKELTFGKSTWYASTDLNGLAAGLGYLPTAAVAGSLEWAASEGTIAQFFPDIPTVTLAYDRYSPDGEHHCLVEVTCLDYFYGGPGNYSMQFAEQNSNFNLYYAAVGDLRIP